MVRSTNVPINIKTLSISINDPEGKSISYTIEIRPDIGGRSSSGTSNGVKSCPVTGLAYGTTYRWWVNASDGSSWTRQWYTFRTVSSTPSNPPANDGGGGSGGGGSDAPPVDENTTPIPADDNTPPEAPFAPVGPTSIECGTNYPYTSSAKDLNGDQVRLQLDWGDGNMSNWSAYVDSNTTIFFYHAWNAPSNYTIFALAQDENGSYSTWSMPLSITVIKPESSPVAPIINITILNNASVNQTIIFDASKSKDPDGKLTHYHWSYGDGTTGTGETSLHSYTEPGVYEVNLTVTDDTQQTYTKTVEVTVDVFTDVPVTTIVSAFSYTSTALLIAECVIVIGMMFILRQRNVLKERSRKHREMSVEEKVDRLLYNKEKK